MFSARGYTLSQLGHGKQNGGFKDHQRNRFEILDKLRTVGELSPVQAGQWIAFRTAWDEKMAAAYQEKWGSILVDILIVVLTDLVENTQHALGDFMEHEKMRWCIELSPEAHLLPHDEASVA